MGESNLPPLRTPEQRKEAMAKAVHTRRERAAFKAACKAGTIPGIGPVTAQKIVEACHIRDGRRVSGLGYMQGPRLVEAIKNNMIAKEDGQ